MRASYAAVLSTLLLVACDAGPTEDRDAGDGALDARVDARVEVDASSDAGAAADADTAVDAAGDGGRDPSGLLEAALDALCDSAAYGQCTAPWSCGCDYDGAIAGSPPEDVEACVAAARLDCETGLGPQIAAGLADGWTVDTEAAARCVAERRHLWDLCRPPPRSAALPRSCRDAIITGGTLDAPCLGPGIRCADGAGLCNDGICRALPATEGASCSTLCAGGLACVAGACAAPVAAGGSCTDHEGCASPALCIGGACSDPAAEGEACDRDDRCSTGLHCEGGECVRRTESCELDTECGAASACGVIPPSFCVPTRDAGEPCTEDYQCSSPLVCVRDPAPFVGACAPMPGLGEPCSGTCAEGLRCFRVDAEGHAVCRPPRAAGEACGRDTIGSTPCADGLACVSGVCGAPPGEGEPCSDDLLCAAELVCVGTSMGPRCMARVSDGAPCVDPRQCREGSYCDAGLCRPRAREGELCGACERGLDCRFEPAEGVARCRAPGGVGDRCGGECADGAFCDELAGSCIPDACFALFPDRY